MPNYKSRWRFKARRWITRYAGGSCQSCQYDKYIGNLIFHHVDPESKETIISQLLKDSASWDTILTEANKCVLVCHNCHGEIHAGLRSCPSINIVQRQQILSEIIAEQPLPLTKQFHKCRCNKTIPKTAKYCSQVCCHLDQLRTEWPHNLPELVAATSKRAVAATLGVSDKAVAKRLKQYHELSKNQSL